MILKEHPDLQAELVRRLVEVYKPTRIYLFGSQVWGEPGAESDVDLYVVLPESTEGPAGRIYHGLKALLDLHIAVDLLVFTEAEIADRIGHPTTLEHKIITLGKKLYAAA